MIQQVAFEGPAEIAVGLATGKYVNGAVLCATALDILFDILSLQMFKMGPIKRCV